MRSFIACAVAVVMGMAGATWGQDAAPATRPATRPAFWQSGLTMGTVAKVEGQNLVVTPMRGLGETQDAVFETNERSVFIVDCEKGALEDLKPEMFVRIRITPGRRGQIDRMTVTATSRSLAGSLQEVGDGKVVVFGRPDRLWTDGEAEIRDAHGGGMSMTILYKPDTEKPREWTFKTDEKTKVLIAGPRGEPGKPGKMEDLQRGMRVQVIPPTGTAAKILITPTARGL